MFTIEQPLPVDARPTPSVASTPIADPTSAPMCERSASSWTATWTAGPDAGTTTLLGTGEHLVGRSPLAVVRCDDPGLEPFHVCIDLTVDAQDAAPAGDSGNDGSHGRIVVRQLCGRVPILTSIVGRTTVVEVGSSRLEVRPTPSRGRGVLAGRAAAGTNEEREGCTDTVPDPRPQVLVRSPRQVPTWEPTPIPIPVAAAPAERLPGGLAATAAAVGGAAAISMIMHQPMFLLFGLIGGLAGLVSWGAQVLAIRRRGRAARRRAADELSMFSLLLAEQRAARIHWHAATVGAIEHSQAGGPPWRRRAGDGDAFVAAAGVGDIEWEPTLAGGDGGPWWELVEAANRLRGERVAVDLGPGARVALCGPHAAAVLRSIVLQIVEHTGPADLRVVVVSDDDRAWVWLDGLPHVPRSATGWLVGDDELGELCADGRTDGQHTLVVTDRPTLLGVRTSGVRRLLAANPDVALLVMAPDESVPAICRSVLTTTARARGTWTADLTTGGLPTAVHVAGLGSAAAAALARRLARWTDPEDPATAGGAVPAAVGLSALLADANGALDATAIAARWIAGGPNPHPATALGIAGDGIVVIDMDQDGPHALVAGTTGAGKSELLRSLVIGLAAGQSPDHLAIVLVDYKGGATFDECMALPHVVGVISDLDDGLAERALRSLSAELRRRERLLRSHGAADLAAVRAQLDRPLMPRLLVVVDEFAALAVEQPDFLHALVDVARRGRSLGVHLVLATQRPNGAISDDIRANTNLRLALRVHDSADSVDVIGAPDAAWIQGRTPGRAIVRLGADERVTFQAAHASTLADGTRESVVLIAAIRHAAELLGCSTATAPWCPPLPNELGREQIAAQPTDDEQSSTDIGVIGLLDLPDEQRRQPLRWTPTDGSLAIVGASGSGVTSALVTLAQTALDLDDHELAVVDAQGDAEWEVVRAHPRCAGVVRLDERERLHRVVRWVASPGSQGRARVLIVDGIAALRAALEHTTTLDDWAMLERAVGSPATTVVIGADTPGSIPPAMLARCADRWVFHLNDRLDAVTLGVGARDVPPAVPGRIFVAGAGATAHLLRPRIATEAVDQATGGPRASRIDVLASTIEATTLPAPERMAGTAHLPLGIEFDTLASVALTLPDGDHVMILGHRRTGRSTALRRLAVAWQIAHPTGSVVVVAPRPSTMASVAAPMDIDDAIVAAVESVGAPTLLVIDDAELVDDPGGRLQALLGDRHCRVTVMAAGRTDAIRQAYGHWTSAVRRSRLGLVMTAAGDSAMLDGDLLGASLPRHIPVPARPGLAHLVIDGEHTLVQCATDDPASGDPRFTSATTPTAAQSVSSASRSSVRPLIPNLS